MGLLQLNQAPLGRRTEPKEVRRRQLMESAIDCLASEGMAGTTMAKVAAGAGLSTGIVNFHFESKDLLLKETLNYVYCEYTANWQRAVAEAGPSPVDQLLAWVRADFSPPICTPRMLGAWYVLWFEIQADSVYRLQWDDIYKQSLRELEKICRNIVTNLGYLDRDPQMIARGLDTMMDGLWLGLMMDRETFDTAGAARVVFAYLHTVFPHHIGPNENLAG